MPRTKAGQQSSFFYGWYVVAACFLVLFVGSGIGFYAFGVFFTPLEKEFGWSRAAIAASVSIATFGAGMGAPIVGRLVDRIGPRSIMLVGAVVMGSCLMAVYFVNELWQFYAIFLFSAIGRAALSPVPVGMTISNWFWKRRGLAMGMAVSGIGIGGMVMAPLTAIIISTIGWRPAILALGAVSVMALLPIVYFLIKRSPREFGLLPLGATAEENGRDTQGTSTVAAVHQAEGLDFQEAIRTPVFWLLCVSFLLIFVGQGSVLIHTVPFFVDRGLEPQDAANILALVSGIGVVGKLGMGYAADKIPARFALMTTFLMQAIGLTIVLMPMSALTIPGFVFFYGIGMGGTVALQSVVVAETFGTKSFGTILGGLSMFQTFSQASGPILAGYIFDTTGSYTIAYTLFVCTASAAGITAFLARPVLKGIKVAAH